MPGPEDLSIKFGQYLVARKVKTVENECPTNRAANKDECDQREGGKAVAARSNGSERRRNGRRESQTGTSSQKSSNQNDP
jgi:hypothetical protein